MNKKIYAFILSFGFIFNVAYAADSDDISQIVQLFKNVIKTDNPQIIADYISYPYTRDFPLSDIENKTQFIQNYDMIFDDELKRIIIQSNPQDWEKVGWRGIMLDSGLIWIDENGHVNAINYTTDKEQKYIDDWYENDRISLHESLRQYDIPVYIFETPVLLGRIDKIQPNQNQQEQYRLALWDKGFDMSSKPKTVLSNGWVEYQGSAHNELYHFKSDKEIEIKEISTNLH